MAFEYPYFFQQGAWGLVLLANLLRMSLNPLLLLAKEILNTSGFVSPSTVAASPDSHNFLSITDSGLAISSASSLRTCRWILSGPMDLCTSKFLKWSQTWSSPAVGGSSFSQFLPLPSANWMMWLKHLLVNTEAKTSLSTSAFSRSQVMRWPHFFQRRP